MLLTRTTVLSLTADIYWITNKGVSTCSTLHIGARISTPHFPFFMWRMKLFSSWKGYSLHRTFYSVS